ncbi:unnamed protein product [Triticum turgidum subsp. durum]|uniref:Uncharacterized protein n=1 Tax=Triticum turgidum subsp. durum TaxID=4567 RepID=A0A9R0STD8_TRITD|nr:unnamed protein product [Triticum turgidum subsp. durum]
MSFMTYLAQFQFGMSSKFFESHKICWKNNYGSNGPRTLSHREHHINHILKGDLSHLQGISWNMGETPNRTEQHKNRNHA